MKSNDGSVAASSPCCASRSGLSSSFFAAALPFDLVELRADFGEKLAPAIDRIVGVLRRESARFGGLLFVKGGVAAEIIVLQPRRQRLGFDRVETRERFLHAVLQEEVIDHAHLIHRVERRLVREDVQQRLILRAEDGIRDAVLRADAMRALIDERRIFEVLVGAALDGIDLDELRVEPRPALREEVIAMPQPFAQRRRVVVHDRIRIQHIVVHMPLREHRDELAEKVHARPRAPGHAFEVQPLDVVLLEEREHVRLAAVLRDVIPRRLVDLRELRARR